MKKSHLFLLAFIVAFGGIAPTEATVIRMDGPGIAVTSREPIEVMIIGSHNNTYQQWAYYDPSIGGIDLDTSWAGPNASIYIPTFGTGYVWYNGYWVDEDGYYWNGAKRVYLNYPGWNNYWSGYWQKYGQGRWDGHRNWKRGKVDHDHWHDRGFNPEWRGRDQKDGRLYDGRGDERKFDNDRQDGWRRDGNNDRRNDSFDRNRSLDEKRDGDSRSGRDDQPRNGNADGKSREAHAESGRAGGNHGSSNRDRGR